MSFDKDRPSREEFKVRLHAVFAHRDVATDNPLEVTIITAARFVDKNSDHPRVAI